MWVLTGPFDLEEGNEGTRLKSKVLKTGRAYSVGRKSQPLVVRHKRISKKHITFIVADCSEEDVLNPDFKPRLSIVADSNSRRLHRVARDEPYVLNQGQQFELNDGDTVELTVINRNPMVISVKWEPLCCYCPMSAGKLPFPLERCAELGVTFTTSPSPFATHHLTPSYTLDPVIATSLLSLAHLVKPQWLSDLLALTEAHPKAGGDDDDEGGTVLSPIERSFSLPPTQKYRPIFAPSLPSDVKQFKVWEPDEARMGLFREMRVVFVGEKGREAPEVVKEVMKRGGGQYECFAVENGKSGLHKVLARAAGREGKVAVVAEEEKMVPAVGKAAWDELMEEVASFEFAFMPPIKIVEAVVRVSTSVMTGGSSQSQNSRQESGSPLPDVIPNTYQNEPSIPPDFKQRGPSPQPEAAAPRRRLPRRAASRASSRAPSPPPAAQPDPPAPQAAPKSRRPLVRRAGRSRAPFLGLEEPSEDLGSQPMSIDTPSLPAPSSPRLTKPPSIAAPTPGRASRLKRRAGTQMPATQLPGLPEDEPLGAATEPPLKKFKALFDESDPDRVARSESHIQFGSGTLNSQLLSQSVTQSEGASGEAGSAVERLVPVLEEEESSAQGQSTTETLEGTLEQTAGRKRKSQMDVVDVDVEIGDAEMDAEQPRAKRRAIEGGNAVRSSTQMQQVAVPAKPPSTAAKPRSHQAAESAQKPKNKAGAGAAPGIPDKDDAFLKAIASTKKGKRTEDTFDREFNKLRISKPDLEHEEEQKEWDVLEDFGDDRNIRGNFMVIMEVEVSERRREANLRRGERRTDWEGRVDFKKFRRKTATHERRPVVELIVDTQDYGLGSQYFNGASQNETQPRADAWATGTSERPQSQADSQLSATLHTFPPSKHPGKAKAPVVAESDEEFADEDALAVRPAAKTRRTQSTQKTKTQKKSNPLFIESDEDVNVEDQDTGFGSEDDDDVSTLSSTAKRIQSTSTKPASKTLSKTQGSRRKYVVVDDDSDDGGTFRRTRTRR